MVEMRHEAVTDPSAWTGADWANDTSWIHALGSPEQAEVERALEVAKAAGGAVGRLGAADFPLPTLGPRLRAVQEEVRTGRGFALLRGLPVEGHSVEDKKLMVWGVGLHLGKAVTQNPRKDLLYDVQDEGLGYGDPGVRGSLTNADLEYHTDGCDLVGLFCLNKAKSGGLSSICSGMSLYNEVLRQHPDYLPALYRGFHYIRREAAHTGKPVNQAPFPVYGVKDGVLSCKFNPGQIKSAYRKTGEPLPPEEREMIDWMARISGSPALRFDMDLQPGDAQLLNNYLVLHARTSFEDWPEPHRKRHLLRLWLTFRERRPLPPQFPYQNGYEDRGYEAVPA